MRECVSTKQSVLLYYVITTTQLAKQAMRAGMKIAYLFPGQGVQRPGMGEDFYKSYKKSREIFDLASSLTGLDIASLCFKVNDRLDYTEYTQVALVTVGIAILKALEETNLKPDVSAGVSLGEYEALFAAGSLSMEDSIKLVRQRGILMQKEVPSGIGSMMAVLDTDISIIEDTISSIENVWVSNYNCKTETVIAGSMQALNEAEKKLKEAGAKKLIYLKVKEPFHTPMMKGAGLKLKKLLDNIEIKKPSIPYIANYTGEAVDSDKDIKELLVKQVYSPVRFAQSIDTMLNMGVDTFIEIGAGNTLTRLVKKTNPNVRAYSIQRAGDIDQVLKELRLG